MTVILIAPPIVRAVEPLLGLAVLSSFLESNGVECTCIDASVEAQEWLLDVGRLDPMMARLEGAESTTAALRKKASSWHNLRRRLDHHKRELRSWAAYENYDRYRTCVTSLNRIMSLAGASHDVDQGSPIQLSLSNYEDDRYCDMDSESVADAARHPEHNLFYDYYRDVLIPRLMTLNPSVVGLSFIFRSQLLCGVVLGEMIRRAMPGVHVVLGGELVSAWAPEMATNHLPELADSIIPYEGELGLLALARAIAADPDTPNLGDVPNLIWRDADGVTHTNPTRKLTSLRDSPTPDYSWAPWDLYFAPVRTAPLVTARGCYWNRCTFCPEVVNPERLLRFVDSRQLCQDMDHLHDTWGVTHFHFIDSALPPRIMRDVATHVVESGRPYSWYGFSRLEKTLRKPGMAEHLAAGGCRMLKLGLETGSQRLLDLMDKHQDLDDVSEILRALESAGVLVHAFLMFGTPFEVDDDANRTTTFVREHATSIQFMNVSLMNLAHGSPMALEPAAHGIQNVIPFEIEGRNLDLALYSNFEGSGWGRLEARRFVHREFLRDPAVRPLKLRTPAHFDSNHSSFFHGLVFQERAARRPSNAVQPPPCTSTAPFSPKTSRRVATLSTKNRS